MKIDHLPETYRRVVTSVMNRIKETDPDDHRILEEFVELVDVTGFSNEADRGEWKPTREPTIEEIRADVRVADGIFFGNVFLAPDIPEEKLVAIVAHEFGHAATTDDDLIDVGGPSDEWRSELAADRKAIGWGFKTEIMSHRETVDRLHHAVGEWIEIDGVRWRITEDLRMEEMADSPR